MDDQFPSKINIIDERVFIEEQRKLAQEQPKPIHSVGDFIKYGTKIYRIASFNHKCYSCVEIGKEFVSSHMEYLLIGTANTRAANLGHSLEVVRMLYL